MPPAGRTARSRIATNENDENTNSTRLTRAKAAALDSNVAQATKQPLQTKRSAVNVNPPAGRRRAALGDVSNVGKSEVVEGKKPVGRTGLVSKAAQPTGVQKSTVRSTTTRTVLGAKETKKTEVKRTGSGSGAIGVPSAKRKITSTTTTVKTEVLAEESEPTRKRAHTSENEEKKHVRAESKAESKVAKVEPAKVEDVVEPEPYFTEHVFPPGVRDLDSEDLDDPCMAAEYATEIFEYLRDLECKTAPNPQYMDHQDDLTWRTRGILNDWLIEVHTRFHLLPETLFLCINIIDRFLSKKPVQLDRLQLVGVTAMFIASKYEEVLSPHVSNFKEIVATDEDSDDKKDHLFSEEMILSAERYMLAVLNYDLSYPNPMNFLRRISKADNYDIQTRTIGKYLMEISLLDQRFLKYRPSHVAAAAIYLARLIFDRGEWDSTIAYYAGYTEEEIEPVFELMVDYLVRPVIHEAFYKKYASKKFLKASLITREWAKRNAHIFGIQDIHLSLDEFTS
ncbi:G2/mitotic-specific cyclin-B [Xylaria flabelliformis]|nr:G2/mitotic-specific cyclin-B [Xylaria flabelliformis]